MTAMTSEQIVLKFLNAMEQGSYKQAMSTLAQDMIFSGAMLEQPSGSKEVLRFVQALRDAFPDFAWNIKHLRVSGSQVTVQMVWGGTHWNPLRIGDFVGLVDAPAVLPTYQHISVPTTMVFTVYGRKIIAIRLVSTPNGGYMSLLRQLGDTNFEEPEPIEMFAVPDLVLSLN